MLTRRSFLGVASGALAWAAAPNWAQGSPRNAKVTALADRAYAMMVRIWPALAYEEDPDHFVLFDDSEESRQELAGKARGLLVEARQLDPGSLSRLDQLLLAHTRRFLGEVISAAERYFHEFTLDGYTSAVFGAQPFYTSFPLATAAQRERYEALIGEVARVADAALAKTRGQVARGIVPPLAILESATQAWRGLAIAPSEANRHFLWPARERLTALDDAAAAAYREKIAHRITSQLAPAAGRLADYLGGDLRAKAPQNPGLGQYPGGQEIYRRWVHDALQVEITPEALHQLGLERVAFYREEIARLQVKMGFRANASSGDFDTYLRTLPGTVVQKAEDWLPHFDRALGKIRPKLPELFAKLPSTEAGFARMPENLESTMTYGWFEVATPSRPRGTYYFNGSPGRLMVSAFNLAFHELLPGHHFQFESAKLGQLHPLQAKYGSSFYTEGWAEYATILAEEQGCYQDEDFQYYGHLSFKSFMAARMVLDTGLNALGWPLEKARAYLAAHSSLSASEVASETIRYGARMPSQALGYHFGLLKLVEERNRVRQALGPRFDPRTFHALLLESGDLPYSALREQVDAMIAAT